MNMKKFFIIFMLAAMAMPFAIYAVAPPDYSDGFCEIRFSPGSKCDQGSTVIYCNSGYQCDWYNCEDWSPSVCGCQAGIDCTDTFNQRCPCTITGQASCGGSGQVCCSGQSPCNSGTNICQSGICVSCGSNGQPCCNGNLCYSNLSCQSNICRSELGCNNGLCESGETSANCPQDCGGCGDAVCSGGETCSSCSSDCGTCSGGGNNPPVLSSISTNVTLIRNGTPVKISSVASDPDGNQVKIICSTKAWDRDLCVSGARSSNPSCNFVANWTDDSNHSIFCVVRDIIGGEPQAWSNSVKTTIEVENTPVLTSVSANPSSDVTSGTTIIVSSIGKDPLLGAPAGSEPVKLVCNDLAGTTLCTGAFASSNPSCSFSSPWFDSAAHSIHCKLIDKSNFMSYERAASVMSVGSGPVLNSFSLSPYSGSSGTNVNIISSGSGKNNKNVQLVCGSSPGAADLCTSVFVNSNPSCSFSSPWTDELQHIVYCRLKDTSDLLSDEKTDVFTAVNKPLLDSVSLLPSSGGSGTSISIISSGNGQGGKSVQLICGSSSGTSNLCTGAFAASNPSCSFSSPWTDELQHIAYCHLKDTSNVLSDEKTGVFTAINKPSLTSVSTQPSTGASGVQITVNSIASDPGSEQIKLVCGSSSGASDLCTGAFAASNPSCSFSYAWSDGLPHIIYCRVQDETFLFSSEKTTQINPNPLPVLTSVSASPVVVKNGNQVAVMSVGSDPEGEQVTLLCGTVSGSSNLCVGAPSALNPSCTFEAQAWPDGTVDIFCRINDIYGQNSNEKTLTITSDNSPPLLSVAHSPQNPYVTTGTTSVTITAASDSSGISNIKIYLEDSVVKECVSSPCTTIVNASVGTYLYSASAEDYLGNSGSSAVQSFTVLQAAQVTAISLSNTCPSDIGTTDVRCTSSVPNINCVAAKIGNVDCLWNAGSRWEGNDAVFAGCSPGEATSPVCGTGTQQATCYIQADKCVNLGSNVSAGLDVKNTSGICSVYNSSNNCAADNNCKWVDFCSASQRSNLPYQCVVKAAAGTYSCKANSCGAECDGSVGCAPKNVNGVCYYSGSCQDNCACDYTSQESCPSTGTVQGTTCYYGSGNSTCTNAGCALSTCQLSLNSRCDAVQGCVADNNILHLVGKIEFSNDRPLAGEIVHAKLSCEVRNSLYPQLSYVCTQGNANINSINVDQETGVSVKATVEAEAVRTDTVIGEINNGTLNASVQSFNDCGLIDGGTSVNLCNASSRLAFSYRVENDGALTLQFRAKGSGTLQILIGGEIAATKAIESHDYHVFIISASVAEGDAEITFNRTSGSIQIDAISVVTGVIEAISYEKWAQGSNWNAAEKYWAIDFDTNIYHSCPGVNMSSGNVSNTTTGCYETQFVRHVEVSTKFQDEQYLPKENNMPVFYKPMLLKTEATGKIVNSETGETETCTSSNCIASYSIDNGTYVSMTYSTAENAFYAEPPTSGLSCNAVHTIKVKITKITEPESGASGSSERSFIIKCEKKLLVLPNEKRAGLMYSGKIFDVTMINPDVSETFEITMSAPKNDFILGNMTFVCPSGSVGCSVSQDAKTVTMQVSSSVGTAYVYVTVTRAGSYPIDFRTSDGLYTGRGTLQVYAESLPDFGIVQLFAIIFIAPLLFFAVKREE